jgi:hypothetical protein
MTRSLESRLRDLEFDVPGDLSFRAKAGAAAKPGRRVHLSRVAVTLAVLLVVAVAANAGATYFAPTYGQALADGPAGAITEPLLRASGLTAGAVTPVDLSATSDGHTIRLVGAYADGLQTVVFLQVDGRPLAVPSPPVGKVAADEYLADETLTDQFGRHYASRGGSGTSWTVYEPLAGPASTVGGRLTLHVSRLTATREGDPSGGPDVRAPHFDGDWTFHFVLVSRPAQDLPRPAPIRLGDTTYTFTSVRAATTLAVHIRVSGGAVSRWNAGLGGDLGDAYFVELYDRAGRPQREGFGEFGGDSIDLSWFLAGPGRYRLHVGSAAQGADVWLDVPRD